MKDMKTTFKLAFVACLMMLSSACHAQKPKPFIDQAFDKFVQDLLKGDFVTFSEMNTYNIGMAKGFNFSVPEKKRKMVETFQKALMSNSSFAYLSFTKKAGSLNSETKRVAYGNDNSMTLEFGLHNDRNYNLQYFRDGKDSTMRYVYALAWYQGTDHSVMGGVYKFYSKDPQTYKTPSANTKSFSYKMPSVQSLDSLFSQGKNLKFNKNWAGTYYFDVTPPKDAAEFMMQLNTLRAAFKNAGDLYLNSEKQVTRRILQAGIVNKIVKLCKEYGKLLNADEKKFCATSLNKMKKDTGDEYLQILLDLTANSLRK